MVAISRTYVWLVAAALLAGGCQSATTITSEPEGATVYVNGAKVGKTPYRYSDTKIVTQTTSITLRKKGCDPVHATFSRTEELDPLPAIAGVCLIVPWLWMFGYRQEHMFEMECKGGGKDKGRDEDD